MRFSGLEASILDLRQLDLLASGNTVIHRMDPRAKVLIALFFIITVVSLGRYEFSRLLPFFIFPVSVILLASVPAALLLKRVLLVLPFAFVIGLFNPFFDVETMARFGDLHVSGGWISFGSIIVKAVLTTMVAMLLVAVTGFARICGALRRLGAPHLMVAQLLFMHRYLFLLAEETARSFRALELRSFGRKGKGPRPFASMTAHLLLRVWERGDRIHAAMLARGYTGDFEFSHEGSIRLKDLLLVCLCSLLLICLRIYDIPQAIGDAAMALFR